MNGFSRHSFGLTFKAEGPKELYWVATMLTGAQFGFRTSTYLFDNDPVISERVWRTCKQLASDMMIAVNTTKGPLLKSYVYDAASNGIAERRILSIKSVLDKNDADPDSAHRKLDISPQLQVSMAHAAINSCPSTVLGGLSPNKVHGILDEAEVGIEGSLVAMQPSDYVCERERYLRCFRDLKNNHEFHRQTAKLEERLAGRRRTPTVGYFSKQPVQFLTKDPIKQVWKNGYILTTENGGLSYRIAGEDGKEISSEVRAESIRPKYEMFHDMPQRVVKVDTLGKDWSTAAKTLLPEEVDITECFYKFTRELQEGNLPELIAKLDKEAGFSPVDGEIIRERAEKAGSQDVGEISNPAENLVEFDTPTVEDPEMIEPILEENKNNLDNENVGSKYGDSWGQCRVCGKFRWVAQEVSADSGDFECRDIGTNCRTKCDKSAKRLPKARKFKKLLSGFVETTPLPIFQSGPVNATPLLIFQSGPVNADSNQMSDLIKTPLPIPQSGSVSADSTKKERSEGLLRCSTTTQRSPALGSAGADFYP